MLFWCKARHFAQALVIHLQAEGCARIDQSTSKRGHDDGHDGRAQRESTTELSQRDGPKGARSVANDGSIERPSNKSASAGRARLMTGGRGRNTHRSLTTGWGAAPAEECVCGGEDGRGIKLRDGLRMTELVWSRRDVQFARGRANDRLELARE